jgi:lipopolysaccharide transport system permease protein
MSTTVRAVADRSSADSAILRPSRGLASFGLRELWRYRELLFFITWRDVKVRYKQTALGAAWAVIQPALLMLVFALFVGRFVPKPHGIPYPIFVFTALVPWTLFAQSLNGASGSLVLSADLVSKVYFPRLILPLAATGSFVLDLVLGIVVLIIVMAFAGITPGVGIVTLPLLALFALLTAFAVGIWLSALNVRYRDVIYAVPFILQIWLFASPVAYPSTIVHGFWQVIYGLNPMAGVIEGFRWALLGLPPPPLGLMAASLAAMLVILVSGMVYFRTTERTFADVI